MMFEIVWNNKVGMKDFGDVLCVLLLVCMKVWYGVFFMVVMDEKFE